jgi:hypothetical protein
MHLSARAYTSVASTCHTESEGGYKVVDLPVLAEVGIRGTQDYAVIQLFLQLYSTYMFIDYQKRITVFYTLYLLSNL